MKLSVEPESTRVRNLRSADTSADSPGTEKEVVSGIVRDRSLGERADALRNTSPDRVLSWSTQLPSSTGEQELRTNFPEPKAQRNPRPHFPLLLHLPYP